MVKHWNFADTNPFGSGWIVVSPVGGKKWSFFWKAKYSLTLDFEFSNLVQSQGMSETVEDG